MSKTKAQLQAQVDQLKTDLRRMNRALGQARIDLSIDEVWNYAEITPHISEHGKNHIEKMGRSHGVGHLLHFATHAHAYRLEKRFFLAAIGCTPIGLKPHDTFTLIICRWVILL